ncbi:MAG: hypothetical protein ACTSXQ_04315 [Alphaproteobacteria bacterium]
MDTENNASEPSMDDILSSIRDIISEDDEPVTQELAPDVVSDIINTGDNADVIELTEMVQGDGSIVSLNEGEALAAQTPSLEELEAVQEAPIETPAPIVEEPPVNVERVSTEGIFETPTVDTTADDIVFDSDVSTPPQEAAPMEPAADAFSINEQAPIEAAPIIEEITLNNPLPAEEEIVLENLQPVQIDPADQVAQAPAAPMIIETSAPASFAPAAPTAPAPEMIPSQEGQAPEVYDEAVKGLEAEISAAVEEDTEKQEIIVEPIAAPETQGEPVMSEPVTPEQYQAPTPMPIQQQTQGGESGLIAGMATDMLKPILQERLAQLLPTLIDQLATPIIQTRLEQILPPLVESIVREMARKEVEEIAKKL